MLDDPCRGLFVNPCVKCEAPAGMFLCGQCIADLRHQLVGLPTFLAYLRDAAVGDTKLSDNAGRYSGLRVETVRYNTKAADLLEEIHGTLGQWATELSRTQHLAISVPVTWRRSLDQYSYTSADYAMFLAAHTIRLARDPDILELCTSLRRYIRRAVNLVNRPIPQQFCGPCPAIISDHRNCEDCGHRRHDCGTRLLAKRGAAEVTCPACGTVHDVGRLINHLLARAEHFRCTIQEMYMVLWMLDETVPLKTLYRWTYEGKLKPAGYLREDRKNIGLTRRSDSDKPVYRVVDARKQRAVKSENTKKQGRQNDTAKPVQKTALSGTVDARRPPRSGRP